MLVPVNVGTVDRLISHIGLVDISEVWMIGISIN